jgi:hypothetical protein
MCRHFNVYVQLHVWTIHLTSLKCDKLFSLPMYKTHEYKQVHCQYKKIRSLESRLNPRYKLLQLDCSNETPYLICNVKNLCDEVCALEKLHSITWRYIRFLIKQSRYEAWRPLPIFDIHYKFWTKK